MTVEQLIEKLSKFPPDMPVAVSYDIGPSDRDDPEFIKVEVKTWVHSNYPYNKADFDFVNLE